MNARRDAAQTVSFDCIRMVRCAHLFAFIELGSGTFSPGGNEIGLPVPEDAGMGATPKVCCSSGSALDSSSAAFNSGSS